MIRVGSWTCFQEHTRRLEAEGCFGQRSEWESHAPGCLTWIEERRREASPRG